LKESSKTSKEVFEKLEPLTMHIEDNLFMAIHSEISSRIIKSTMEEVSKYYVKDDNFNIFMEANQ
jgi:hypothetical protein